LAADDIFLGAVFVYPIFLFLLLGWAAAWHMQRLCIDLCICVFVYLCIDLFVYLSACLLICVLVIVFVCGIVFVYLLLY